VAEVQGGEADLLDFGMEDKGKTFGLTDCPQLSNHRISDPKGLAGDGAVACVKGDKATVSLTESCGCLRHACGAGKEGDCFLTVAGRCSVGHNGMGLGLGLG